MDLHTTGTVIMIGGALICAGIGGWLYIYELRHSQSNKGWRVLVLYVLLALTMVIGALAFQEKITGAAAAGFIGTIVGVVAMNLRAKSSSREQSSDR